MENIKTYTDFELNENFSDELLEIPKSTIEGWIRSIEAQEDSLNETIYAKESMQEFLDQYYENNIEPGDPDDFDEKYREDEPVEEIDELSSDDENPTFIKKFED